MEWKNTMNDRERLLKILNVPIYPHENVDPLEAVADYLLDNGVTFAKDTNVPSWIPVTERLPDKDGKFLVHRIICGGISTMSVVGFAHNGTKVHEYDLRKKKNVWYEYDSEVGYYPLTTVTHWMPLPEPPTQL
jgi:hypothetical protein